MSIKRYVETIAHLRPSQIYWQLARRIQKRLEPIEPIGNYHPTNATFVHAQTTLSTLTRQPVPSQPIGEILRWRFRFLNRIEDLSGTDSKWSRLDLPKLWQYNLHYFDWLWSLDSTKPDQWEFAKRSVLDWIKNHNLERNALGWEPYPTSLRLINWSLLFRNRWIDQTLTDTEFANEIACSICKQLLWLERHLEFQIQANHLLENAVALVVATRYATGSVVDRLKKTGNRLSMEQLREQILGDGMHYERSPMYHARVLWLVELLESHGDRVVAEYSRGLIVQMKQALEKLRHSDGSLVLFNDSANGIYSLPVQTDSPHVSHKLTNSEIKSLHCWELPNAGFFGAFCYRRGRSLADSFACSCGTISPHFQPGHAHADTFTFEWFLDGNPFLTDTGVFEYAAGERREWDRSTSAHNTVQVDNRNSSDVWASFRVGRRATVKTRSWKSSNSGFTLEACHDGFRPFVHSRSFQYSGDELKIFDRIDGKKNAIVTWSWHFGPDVKLVREGECIIAELGMEKTMILLEGFPEGYQIETRKSRYSPEFGKSILRDCIVIVAEVHGSIATTVKMKVIS